MPETCACAVTVSGVPVLETETARESGARALVVKLNARAVKLTWGSEGTGTVTCKGREAGVVSKLNEISIKPAVATRGAAMPASTSLFPITTLSRRKVVFLGVFLGVHQMSVPCGIFVPKTFKIKVGLPACTEVGVNRVSVICAKPIPASIWSKAAKPARRQRRCPEVIGIPHNIVILICHEHSGEDVAEFLRTGSKHPIPRHFIGLAITVQVVSWDG